MTPSEQPRLLLRKAAQDLAVFDKLIDDAAIDDETLGYHAQQAAEKLIRPCSRTAATTIPAVTTSAYSWISWKAMAFLCQ